MKKLIAIAIVLFLATSANAGILDNAKSLIPAPAHSGAQAMSSDSDIGHGSGVVYLSYCVKSDGFNTGVHLYPDSRKTVKMYVFFFNGTSPYAYKVIYLTTNGWTGFISDLLPSGVAFRSPSTILLVTANTSDNPRFWADEFIFSCNGFGFEQFESEIQ